MLFAEKILKNRILYSLIYGFFVSCLISSAAIFPATDFIIKELGYTEPARTVYEVIGLTLCAIVFAFSFRHYYRQWGARTLPDERAS
jgi:hypothetical protein